PRFGGFFLSGTSATASAVKLTRSLGMRTASSCARRVRRGHSVQPPVTRESIAICLLNEVMRFFLKIVSSPSSAISNARGTQESRRAEVGAEIVAVFLLHDHKELVVDQ